jgi:hypothetical protein
VMDRSLQSHCEATAAAAAQAEGHTSSLLRPFSNPLLLSSPLLQPFFLSLFLLV